MSRRQTFIRTDSPSPSTNRGRPLLNHNHSNTSSSCSGRFAEVAGGTTAECAAICCCCPCGLVNLLILAMYKVPAGLCRRAWRRKKRQSMMKKGLLPAGTKRCKCVYEDSELQIQPVSCGGINGVGNNNNDKFEDLKDEVDVEKMVKFEKEMWESFYSTGFWRSPSQREAPLMKLNTSSSRETTYSVAPLVNHK